jgi:hypothetical protein
MAVCRAVAYWHKDAQNKHSFTYKTALLTWGVYDANKRKEHSMFSKTH